MKIKGSNKEYGNSYIPKLLYGSELSVSIMQNLDDNIVHNAEKDSSVQLESIADAEITFHNIDDSIEILIDNPDIEFVS